MIFLILSYYFNVEDEARGIWNGVLFEIQETNTHKWELTLRNSDPIEALKYRKKIRMSGHVHYEYRFQIQD